MPQAIPIRLILATAFALFATSVGAQEPPKAPASFAPLLQKLWPEAEAKVGSPGTELEFAL